MLTGTTYIWKSYVSHLTILVFDVSALNNVQHDSKMADFFTLSWAILLF